MSAGQVAIGVAGFDEGEEFIYVPGFQADHGEDHLGKHVERRIDRIDRFDVAIHDALRYDGAIKKITSVGRVEEAAARLADAVSGTADPLDRR